MVFENLWRLRRPAQIERETGSDSLNIERSVIRQHGGIVNKRLFGPDGKAIIGGRPMEVKFAKKDPRFRVGKLDHERMLAGNGLYIFVNKYGDQVKLSAKEADKLLLYGWLQDRAYPHSFIAVSDVFKNMRY